MQSPRVSGGKKIKFRREQQQKSYANESDTGTNALESYGLHIIIPSIPRPCVSFFSMPYPPKH